MNKMMSAQKLVVSGVIGLVVVETLVTTISTSGWNAAVCTFAGTLIPIVFAASIVMGIFEYFGG